jgi:CHAT domain-containing protein
MLAASPAIAHGEWEVAGIAAAGGVTMMTRTDFTRRALHAAISGTRYAKLHIASPILLGVEPIDAFFIANDGLVTVASLLAALDARSDPLDLLVLSAADLRPWSSRASDIAMLVAGDNLRSVVVSLWPAPTDSRMDLLTEMYRRLASGDSKAPSAHAWRARPTRRVGRRCSWWGTRNDKGSRRYTAVIVCVVWTAVWGGQRRRSEGGDYRAHRHRRNRFH